MRAGACAHVCARVCVCARARSCACISGPDLQAHHLVLQSRKLAAGRGHLIALIGIKGQPHLRQVGASCAAKTCHKHTKTHARIRIYLGGEWFGWHKWSCGLSGVAHVRKRLSCRRTGAIRTQVCASACQRCLCLCRFRCVRVSVRLCVCVCARVCALGGWRHTHQARA